MLSKVTQHFVEGCLLEKLIMGGEFFKRVTVLVAWFNFATLGCVPRSAAGPECGVSECCVREVRC